MLANPAQPRFFRQRLFQHRRAVHKYPIAEWPDGGGEAVSQALQALAQHLVIIPAQRVARHITQFRVLQHAPRLGGIRRQIVHPRRDDAHCAGNQFRRSAAPDPVPGHVAHRAVKPCRQPVQQPRLGFPKINVANADPLKAQFPSPGFNGSGEFSELGSGKSNGHGDGWNWQKDGRIVPLIIVAQEISHARTAC